MAARIIISGTVWVEPSAKERPRLARGGFTYTPTKTRKKEAEIKRELLVHMNKAGLTPFEGACMLSVNLYSTRPKKPSCDYPSRFDLDNALKLFSDAANGTLFKDDRQISCIHAKKLFSETDKPGYIEYLLLEVIPEESQEP